MSFSSFADVGLYGRLRHDCGRKQFRPGEVWFVFSKARSFICASASADLCLWITHANITGATEVPFTLSVLTAVDCFTRMGTTHGQRNAG